MCSCVGSSDGLLLWWEVAARRKESWRAVLPDRQIYPCIITVLQYGNDPSIAILALRAGSANTIKR